MRKLEPNFERLRIALLCLGEPDRVPLAELGIDQKIKEGFLGKPIRDIKTEIEFWVTAGYDYVKLSPIVDFNPAKRKPKEGEHISSATELDISRTWVSEKEGVITSLEDFEKYRFPKEEEIDYSAFEIARKYLPSEIKIIGQHGDIFTKVWTMMGFETFAYSLIENPSLVQLMFDKIGSIIYSMFKTMADFDEVGALWYSDDIAYTEGLMVSPNVLRKYLFPWMKKIGNLAKSKNLPFIYHTDGKIYEVLDDIINCGVNALHPIEPKAMDIVALKKQVGGKLCLIGNIDLSFTLTRGTVEDVIKETKQRIKEVAPGGGYCLGSSNSVPAYVPIENYRAMIETALRYGTYPIQIS